MVPRSMVSHHDCCFITSESSDEKRKREKGEKLVNVDERIKCVRMIVSCEERREAMQLESVS